MAALRGSAGYSVIGDKSIEFYKDPISFANWRIEQYDSRVFVARLLNKPTVFIGSINGIKELTGEKSSNFDLGYRSFLQPIFGDNIMFEGTVEAARLHKIIHELYGARMISSIRDTIKKLTRKHFSSLHKSSCINVYDILKQFATELSLALFLGLDLDEHSKLVEDIIALTRTHWHGIISVPLSIRLSVLSSTYSRSLDAKEKLLAIIRDRLSHIQEGSLLQHVAEAGFQSQAELEHHILLFTSALVPKALASMMTSFLLITGSPDKRALRMQASHDENCLVRILLEVERLWPPFLGGRRLAIKDCIIDGYRIPQGHAVVYMTHAAHRDPSVFAHPDTFKPDRWNDREAEGHKFLFTYGGGVRCCVGTSLMKTTIQTVCQYLLDHYTWSIPAGQELSYKWLPVSRPKEKPVVCFKQEIPLQETAVENSVDQKCKTEDS